MIKKEVPFLIEVTPKTPADVKGGTLYEQNGKLKLLEIAQVPEEHIDEFCSQKKFSVFNTNNIWINLSVLEKKLEDAQLIITGEGRFDRSSLQGKGPGTLITKALNGKKRILVFAGLLSDDINTYLPKSFNKENLIQITPDNCTLEQALSDGRYNLARAIRDTVT